LRSVAGLEADFQFSSLKGTDSSAFGLVEPATYFAQQEIDEFGTARARLGWLPTNNVLLYAMGGFAYGRVKDSVSVTAASNNQLDGFKYFCSPAAGPTENRIASLEVILGGRPDGRPERVWNLLRGSMSLSGSNTCSWIWATAAMSMSLRNPSGAAAPRRLHLRPLLAGQTSIWSGPV
jgi:opacity protein-like surface antigen